jgi:glutaredoxin-related protein
LPVPAQWPNCPRVWANDKLIEGDDIVSELNQSRELKNYFSSNETY